MILLCTVTNICQQIVLDARFFGNKLILIAAGAGRLYVKTSH